ncbi:MAG: hypothetical protein NTV49_02310 [Kiritimatiellaeota bacterium]|nr:hypothetical protein [Kiritimatiellota bacterium]
MAFARACAVRTGAPLFDAFCPGYDAGMRFLYRLVLVVRPHADAYTVMNLFSAACAALTVHLFFLFCYRRFSLQPLSSLFAAGFFMFSYGFWRYASEAESIVSGACIALAAFYTITRPNLAWRHAVGAGLLGACAVTVYFLNIVPVAVMMPLYLLSIRRKRLALLYSGVLLVVGALLMMGLACHYGVAPTALWPHDAIFPHRTWLPIKAAVGFGQCLLSGNFLLGLDPVRVFLTSLFPYRMLGEEMYLGHRLRAFEVAVPLVTLLVVAGAFLVGAVLIRRALRSTPDRVMPRSGSGPLLAGVLLWFAGDVAIIFSLQPGNPESWVMSLVPFWLAFCGLLIVPLARANKLWVVLLLLLGFTAHNYFGGMRCLGQRADDYNYAKSAPVLQRAGSSDVVITAENPGFVRYLRYYAAAIVVDLNALSSSDFERLLERLPGHAGKIYLFNEVFDYPAFMRRRDPRLAAEVTEYAGRLRSGSRKILENEFGGIYEWKAVGRGK